MVVGQITRRPPAAQDMVADHNPTGAAMTRTDAGQGMLDRFDSRDAAIQIDLADNPRE